MLSAAIFQNRTRVFRHNFRVKIRFLNVGSPIIEGSQTRGGVVNSSHGIVSLAFIRSNSQNMTKHLLCWGKATSTGPPSASWVGESISGPPSSCTGGSDSLGGSASACIALCSTSGPGLTCSVSPPPTLEIPKNPSHAHCRCRWRRWTRRTPCSLPPSAACVSSPVYENRG